MLPVSEVVYHSSYDIRGLREQLDQTSEDILRDSHSGWPRLIALFRVLFEGSDHGQFPVVKYGGRLFEPGDAASNDPVLRAIPVFENSDGPSNLELKQILDLLGKTFTRLRYRRGARPFAIPVDFSAMDTEYIGILYEGLLDFNLKRAPEPIVSLQIGDYPALPWSSLRDMEQERLEALLENLKKKSTRCSRDGRLPRPLDWVRPASTYWIYRRSTRSVSTTNLAREVSISRLRPAKHLTILGSELQIIRIRQLRYSTFIGPPTWTCTPIRPLRSRFGSSSITMLMSWPLILCMSMFSRAMM